jgi:uncharacterized repeat protein (TIGR02543 family)
MHRYVERVGIFLVMAALIVGMPGCEPVSCAGGQGANPPGTQVRYNLTVAANPVGVGGGTATDLTNTSPYTAGTVVNIQAVAASGYQFVNWSATASTFGNATAANTTFTMPAQAVTVTANFVAQYDLALDSTVGGNVTTPGEGLFPEYDAGTVVDLVATPDAGYQFVNWTGDVSTVANVTATITNITMNGDYSITANFEVEETTPVTLFQAVHFGQNQGNWNVGLWKYYGNGTQDGYVNQGGNGAVRWDDGSQGTDHGLTHSFILTYDPMTYTLSFQVTGGSKTVFNTTTSPVVPPDAPGLVNNLHMVIQATAGTNVSCANQASMFKQAVNYSKTTVSNLTLDGIPLTGIEVEAKLVDNATSESFTNKAELDIPVPTGVAWTLTGEIAVSFVAANMAAPPKQWRIGMPQLSGQYA